MQKTHPSYRIFDEVEGDKFNKMFSIQHWDQVWCILLFELVWALNYLNNIWDLLMKPFFIVLFHPYRTSGNTVVMAVQALGPARGPDQVLAHGLAAEVETTTFKGLPRCRYLSVYVCVCVYISILILKLLSTVISNYCWILLILGKTSTNLEWKAMLISMCAN